YCDFPISVVGNQATGEASPVIAEYLEYLLEEISLTVVEQQPLQTIFFGGGTPSLLGVGQVKDILAQLNDYYQIAPDAEISMEIDPGTFSQEQLQGYRDVGINRFSLGVQAFQDELLEVCGRFHRRVDIFQAIEVLEKLQIDNFSLDLISGLPNQTLAQWHSSLAEAVSISPAHISCYDLVLEPTTVFGKFYQVGKTPLPAESVTARMYTIAQETLTQAGYQHYEISNYSKPGSQCRHNLVYWQNKFYYGFGMGAASYVDNVRYTRPRTRREYYSWVKQLQSNDSIRQEKLSKNDVFWETLMLGLRLTEGVNLPALAKKFGTAIVEQIKDKLAIYQQKGWIELLDWQDQPVDQSSLRDTTVKTLRLKDPEGFLFSNTILSDLFTLELTEG
ncbi:MAG: coproporphyrinogen III oxidase, partial [Cyanobacteria bacterium J083]